MIDWKGELFEWVPGCIGIFRHDGKCLRTVALNAKMRDILGVTEEDVQTSTCKELLQIHPDDRENLYSSFDQAIIDKRDTLEIKARFYRRKLKQYVWFQANFQFQYRSDGETIVYALYQDVTSRMRMKEKLQHNIKTMRTAMDQCGVYYALYDIDANTITYNSKMQQDFGVPAVAQRNAGKPRRLMTESGRAELIRLEQLLMTGKQDSISLEMEIRRPMRGDWIWSKQNYTVADRNEQGAPTMIAATALDITKEKEEEKRFSQENMYHQLLFNNMTSVIRINITAWKVLDYAGEYVLIHERENDPFGVIIDHITDEEQKKEFTRIFHRNNLIHLFESGQRQVSYTFRSKRLSGKTLWMKIVLDMTAREGEDIYGFVSLQDVDRNVIKELVRGQVVDSMIDFIAYWNTAANDSQIFTRYECYQVDASFEGKKKVEKLQEQLINLVIPEEREIINAQMSWEVIHARIQHGLSWDFMYHAQDEELGVRTKRIFAFFLENDESVIVMVQRDVTDIMSEQEKQNAELQRALEIANRASHARDEFLSSMSHDLRTPLNGIIGAAELAKLFGDEVPDMVQEYLDDIISSGHFMLNLVNDILDTNRLASGKLELHLKKIDIQHISSGHSVEMVRLAKKMGAHVWAEVTPHHFTLTEDAVLEHGTLAKMNPPLRTEWDRQMLIEGLKDGTIDMIATDHAPHSKEEKEKPITEAPSGITGLETSLALGITSLVKPGHLTLMELMEKMSLNPAKLYKLDCGRMEEGAPADFVIFDENEKWVVDSFASKATNSPFLGAELTGRVRYTICDGKVVYTL